MASGNSGGTLKLVFKIIESVSWVVGSTLFTLNFFSFKVGKMGAYYENATGWGIAIGVLFLSLAFVSRQWQK